MSGTSIFIGTTSCFRLGPLKSGIFGEVESNVKMTRCRLQSGDGMVGMARWRLESRERLPSWKMLGAERGCLGGGGWKGGDGKAAEVVQGEAVKLEKAVDGEVKMVR